jgi:pyruvate decarboxylase
MPLDLAWEQVPSNRLEKRIDTSLPLNKSALSEAASAVVRAVNEAENPCIFIDGLVHRHNAIEEAKELVEVLQVPIYCANMGKGIIDDTHPRFVGLYNGTVSSPGVAKAIQRSDLVLLLGSIPADTNTGGFTRTFSSEKLVEINPFDVVV